jgi:hypothetical protein
MLNKMWPALSKVTDLNRVMYRGFKATDTVFTTKNQQAMPRSKKSKRSKQYKRKSPIRKRSKTRYRSVERSDSVMQRRTRALTTLQKPPTEVITPYEWTYLFEQHTKTYDELRDSIRSLFPSFGRHAMFPGEFNRHNQAILPPNHPAVLLFHEFQTALDHLVFRLRVWARRAVTTVARRGLISYGKVVMVQ